MKYQTHILMTPATRTKTILDEKAAAKAALQEELGWEKQPRRALLCIPSGMTDELGGALLELVMPGLLTLPIQIAVVGKGSSAYGTYFTKLATEKPHKVGIVGNNQKNIDAMLTASDLALFCAPPGDNDDLRVCLEHGIVAVSPAVSALTNYDPNQEAGNAFTYDQLNPWLCFAAMVRAVETYRFPYDWKTIQQHCVAASDEEIEEDDA